MTLVGGSGRRAQGSAADGGPNPFTAGPIGEWGAQRAKVVEEAVPRFLKLLRPKYGRMYNFDDAQPGNIRLLALSVQPSLTNR